jgi:hypothetical protein
MVLMNDWSGRLATAYFLFPFPPFSSWYSKMGICPIGPIPEQKFFNNYFPLGCHNGLVWGKQEYFTHDTK